LRSVSKRLGIFSNPCILMMILDKKVSVLRCQQNTPDTRNLTPLKRQDVDNIQMTQSILSRSFYSLGEFPGTEKFFYQNVPPDFRERSIDITDRLRTCGSQIFIFGSH